MKNYEHFYKSWKLYNKITLISEDKLPGGAGDDKPDTEFDQEQLKIGIKHELEHTKDEKIAKEIAKDHLTEDPNYYKKIKKIEKA